MSVTATAGVKVKAAGIAPAGPMTQVVFPKDGYVESEVVCLHDVCTDVALPVIVAAWPRLSPEVREKISALVRSSEE